MSNTKQRLTVVALLGILTVSASFYESLRAAAADDQAQKGKASTNDLAMKLIGTWKLETTANPGSPSGIGTRLKLFTGTHWCVVQPHPDTGLIIFQHGGHYVLEGNQLRATTDFAGEVTKSFIGRTGTVTIQIDGDTYKQVDPNGVFNETWKRVK
jgi:hypothetical protein